MGYAESLTRRIVVMPQGTAALQRRVDELLPEMLCWFGPPGEAGVEALVADGILSRANEDLRQRYLARVAPLLLEVGMRLPVRWNLEAGAWEYDDLPWDRWNQLQRRLDTPTSA